MRSTPNTPARGLPFELAALIVLLFAVPAHLVVPGFGAAGAPASLLGLVMLGLLVIGVMFPQLSDDEPLSADRTGLFNPVVLGLGLYVVSVVAAWTYGKLRPLSELAANTSDRAIIAFFSLVGVTLFIVYRVRTERAVLQLVDAVLYGATFMCAIGLVQFFFSYDLSAMIRPPGLASNTGFRGIPTRSIFNRPFGTALHPIEFGVVAGALLPIAYWRARRGSKVQWVILFVLAFSAMASISRSAILAIAVGVFVLLIGSSWRDRIALVLGGTVFVIVAGSVVPGLVGTLLSLFQETENNPSIRARLERTPEVLRLIAEHPWFGRGYGTFTPEEYLLLDNQIQKMTIETGVIGVAIFFVLNVVLIWTASKLTDPHRHQTRGLALALIASILGIVLSYYTFDAFFYHILRTVLFINIGLLGALWRIYHLQPASLPPSTATGARPISNGRAARMGSQPGTTMRAARHRPPMARPPAVTRRLRARRQVVPADARVQRRMERLGRRGSRRV